jgi:hypothetical protein
MVGHPLAAATSRCLDHGGWRPLSPSPRNLTEARFVGTSAEPGASSGRYQCEGARRARGLDLQRLVWQCQEQAQPSHGGAAPSRPPAHLRDPLTSSFGGVFSNPQRPVHIAMLSDSLGAQVRSALEGAKAANPVHLRMLSFARGNAHANSALRPLNLATIPSDAAGVASLLNSIDWPAVPFTVPSAAGAAGGAAAAGAHRKRAAANGNARAAAAAPDLISGGSAPQPVAPVRIILAGSGMW